MAGDCFIYPPYLGGILHGLVFVAQSHAMAQNGTVSSFPLEGKVYAITGGASGIGLATAKGLARKGAIVCIADVDEAALDSAASFFTSQKRSFKASILDVSKRTDVESWMDSIVSEFGRLDGAANVAGIIGKGHNRDAVADLDDNEWDQILAVNLTGMMYCLRAELKRVVDGGSIVNVASIHGTKGMPALRCSQPRPFPCPPRSLKARAQSLIFLPSVPGFARHAAYDASKHGVIGLTKAAAQENGPREVRVNAVAPGSIYTPLMQKHWDLSGRPSTAPFDEPSAFQRHGTAEEVANVIVFLLGPESTFVSGSVYAVDGAWS